MFSKYSLALRKERGSRAGGLAAPGVGTRVGTGFGDGKRRHCVLNVSLKRGLLKYLSPVLPSII